PNTSALIRLRLSFASRRANTNQKYAVNTFPNMRRSSAVSVLASSRASNASPSSRLSWTSAGCFIVVPFRHAGAHHNEGEVLQTGRCIAEAVRSREGQLASSPLAPSRFKNQQNEAIRRKSNPLAGRVRLISDQGRWLKCFLKGVFKARKKFPRCPY